MRSFMLTLLCCLAAACGQLRPHEESLLLPQALLQDATLKLPTAAFAPESNRLLEWSLQDGPSRQEMPMQMQIDDGACSLVGLTPAYSEAFSLSLAATAISYHGTLFHRRSMEVAPLAGLFCVMLLDAAPLAEALPPGWHAHDSSPAPGAQRREVRDASGQLRILVLRCGKGAWNADFSSLTCIELSSGRVMELHGLELP